VNRLHEDLRKLKAMHKHRKREEERHRFGYKYEVKAETFEKDFAIIAG